MKKNISLIIGIALPVVLVIIISCVIYLPSLSVKPAYNFVYTTGGYGYDQSYRNTYVLKEGFLSIVPFEQEKGINYNFKGDTPPLYVYDVKNDTLRTITFDDARTIALDPGPSSVDGYTVGYEYNNSGIFDLFGSRNSDGYYVSKGNAHKKLPGLSRDRYGYYYDGNIKFIGWIK